MTRPGGSTREPTPFDLAGPLPVGTTVLEASAGTGKTHAIAALAARYIAQGVAELSEIMMVTFGRMATNELRLRVRERLARTERVLAGAAVAADPVDHLLAAGTPAEVDQAHRRVRAALADFDAATIATTHEFCQTMLDGLGVLGDAEPGARFTESVGDLTREVAADCYLRRFAAEPAPPPFDAEQARTLADEVVQAISARLVPGPPDGARGGTDRSAAAQRVAFAADVRTELARRKRVARLYSYDDMLTRLQSCLADPVSGDRAAARLRQRYRVVLVDEFQDTDPTQWDILRRAFHTHATLVLIGDPKQAIYAFRGADVYSYLDAVGTADAVATLETNWRSDAPLLAALDGLFDTVALGDRRIVVRPVLAGRPEPRLRMPAGAPALPPLRIRVREPDPTAERPPGVDVLRPEIEADLARDVVALLDSGTEVVDESSAGPTEARWRPIGPGDIAVLVRTNKRLEPIRDALAAAGVPAVVRGAGSVFTSTAATDWQLLLTACEQPWQGSIRRLALTAFVGWQALGLATAEEEQLNRLSAMVRRWSRTLARSGVAALQAEVTEETGLAERLLGTPGGERRLTDLRHVGEMLHAAMIGGRLGTGALLVWLTERIAEAHRSRADELSRRLETDAAAVQVLTVHRSKGLEFPVVYLPDAWDRHLPDDDGRPFRLHDEDGLALDVGGLLGPGRADRLARSRDEDAGEDLRLAYVALTRARSRVVTWWMPSWNTPGSALQRLWFRSRVGSLDGAAPLPRARYDLGPAPRPLPGVGPDLIGLERLDPTAPAARWQPPLPADGELGLRRFDRVLDLAWRRTSYSALTAAAHGLVLAPTATEAEIRKEDDETSAAEVLGELVRPTGPGPDGGTAAGSDLASPMGELPMGTQFGTVVHAVLERLDPRAALADDDLPGELTRLAADELARGPAGTLTAEQLGPALAPALLTPLGPLADDRRLVDIPVSDRLPELTFELPLAGGDRPTAEVRLGDLVPLLRRHLGPADPLHDYPDRLAVPLLADQPLRGYLTGSIDAVLRVREPAAGDVRYLVVDYKTNWLGDPDVSPLPLAAYAPPLLAEAMMAAHYPLQALLYGVAVHRFLRWRQRDYDPERHLGGVLYLFVRGMAGPETPRGPAVADRPGAPYGVFSWLPPAALTGELSDLLDGHR